MEVKNDCCFFRGDVPCIPHKKTGVHCENCQDYKSCGKQILIIKLGAAGDVIRTTPILHKITSRYQDAEITWLTRYPVFVPKSIVANILNWNVENIIWLQSRKFDMLYNFEKDREAIGLASIISAKIKKGYLVDRYGKCKPADADAEHKWITGIFDDISRANQLSYPEEILNICGFSFNREKYILDIPKTDTSFNLESSKKIIALNTGCGKRWQTRLWGKENWIELSKNLYENGYLPLLLGGQDENDMNIYIEKSSPAVYLGYFSLDDFINLVNRCDLIVTSVTMAAHLAIALNKKIVLLNNTFNRNEFELYDLGVILEPKDKDCLGCYDNYCPEICMSSILPELVYSEVVKLLED